MVLGDHHEWVRYAANQLMCGGDTLWQAMCAEWANKVKPPEIQYIPEAIERALA